MERVSTVTDLTCDLVRLPTTNPPGAEHAASDLVADRLGAGGLDVVRVPVQGHGDAVLAVLPGADRAAPARIFTGHLDVVPVSAAERTRWASDPFTPELRDGRLVGRGASDMKGGVAALVTAALHLARERRTPPADVIVALTTDEEDLMSGSKAIADHPLLARDADLVVCEPTSLRPCKVGRGRTWASLTLRGRTGHGSSAGEPNAIELMVALLNRLATEDFSDAADIDHGVSFWRPLAINAGVEPCVVPDVCTLTLDARLVPDHSPDDVWRRLDAHLDVLRRHFPWTSVDVDVIDRREGWRTSPDAPLVRETFAALDALGVPGPRPRDLAFAGTTDGTVLRRADASHGVRDVVIVGPGDLAEAHRENESVALAQLDQAVALYRALMLRG